MCKMEDLIVDSMEDDENVKGGSVRVVSEKIASLAELSRRLGSDRAFARQLKRKYVH